jgi:hypothetical protein
MKRDIRKQTFSKPGKPNSEEIKRLTNDESESLSPVTKKIVENEVTAKPETIEPINNDSIAEKNEIEEVDVVKNENVNPFLLSRGQASEISIEKTGYRLRSDYMDLLKLVKRMKKGYTLEAILDDVLTFYFENSEDGRKAVKQRAILDAQ